MKSKEQKYNEAVERNLSRLESITNDKHCKLDYFLERYLKGLSEAKSLLSIRLNDDGFNARIKNLQNKIEELKK